MRTGLPAWAPAHEPGAASPAVACPVLAGGDAAGAIGLVPRDAEQDAALRAQGRQLTDLLLVVADLLAGAAAHRRQAPGAIAPAERMQAVLDSLGDGVLAVDHAGIVLYCNRAALDKLRAEMDLTGQPLAHWYPPAADRRPEEWHGEREVTFDRRGERLRFVETVGPWRRGDRVIGRLVVLRDIPVSGPAIRPLCPTLAEAERQLIQEVIARHGTSGDGKRQAARALGVSLATLYRKLRRYGLS